MNLLVAAAAVAHLWTAQAVVEDGTNGKRLVVYPGYHSQHECLDRLSMLEFGRTLAQRAADHKAQDDAERDWHLRVAAYRPSHPCKLMKLDPAWVLQSYISRKTGKFVSNPHPMGLACAVPDGYTRYFMMDWPPISGPDVAGIVGGSSGGEVYNNGSLLVPVFSGQSVTDIALMNMRDQLDNPIIDVTSKECF